MNKEKIIVALETLGLGILIVFTMQNSFETKKLEREINALTKAQDHNNHYLLDMCGRKK